MTPSELSHVPGTLYLDCVLCFNKCIYKKVKSNYFIVRPKVDQRAGLT